MNPEAQRIAIGRYCGWKFAPHQELWVQFGRADNTRPLQKELPNYLTDLNAMHGAEGIALQGMATIIEYERHIRQITLRDAKEGSGLYERIIRATAAQRAEAFLRTIGKWSEKG